MYYDCDKKAIIITPLGIKNNTGLLYISKKCCEKPTGYLYCNEEAQTNILGVSITVDNLQQNKEEPRFDCYFEASWDEFIAVNLTDVASFTGTKTNYLNGVVDSIDTLDLSYFNTTHEIWTSIANGDRKYIFDLTFVLNNGLTIHYEIIYIVNVLLENSDNCKIKDFTKSVSHDFTCTNTFGWENNIGTFPIDLEDGFYTVSYGDINGCFVVDCEETLQKAIDDFVEKTLDKNCYCCNTKENLEANFNLEMYMSAFTSDCLDCCQKCNVYYKMLKITKGCKDC